MRTVTAVDQNTLLSRPDWYRRLPAGKDVHLLGTGVVAVTGNRAAREALTHPGLVADHPLKASSRAFGPNVLDCDGARHREFRALLAPILAAGRIERWRRLLMPGLIDALVDDVLGRETEDFYRDHAHRVPYGIVCTILGVDRSLEGRFHELTRPLARLLDYPTEETEATHASMAALLALLGEECRAESLRPDSLLGTIERTRDRKGIALTDEEVRSTALLFFLAGTETSSAFITSMVYCLGRSIMDMDELLDESVRDAFIEETLRLYPPVQTIARFAEADLLLGDVPVPRHSLVLVSLAAANRDPEIFPHPGRFDVGRATKASVPFSVGPHSCPGAPLAKTEFMLLLETLARRCAQVSITGDRVLLESQSFSRPVGFSVRFQPRSKDVC